MDSTNVRGFTTELSSATSKDNTNRIFTSITQIQDSKERIRNKVRELEGAVARLRTFASNGSPMGDSFRHSELRFRVKTPSNQPRQSSISVSPGTGTSGALNNSNHHESSSTEWNGGDTGCVHGAAMSRSSTPSTINSEIDEVRTILGDIDSHLSALRDIEREHSLVCEQYTKDILQRDEQLESKSSQLKKVENELELIQVQVHELQCKNSNMEKVLKKQLKDFTGTETESQNEDSQSEDLDSSGVMTAPGALNQNADNVYRFHEEAKPLDFRQLYFDLLKKNHALRLEELAAQPVVEDETEAAESDNPTDILKAFGKSNKPKTEDEGAHVKIDVQEPDVKTSEVNKEPLPQETPEIEAADTKNVVEIGEEAIEDNARERARAEKRQELYSTLAQEIETAEFPDCDSDLRTFELALERARRVYLDSNASPSERIGAGMELLGVANILYDHFGKLKKAAEVWFSVETDLRNRLVDYQMEMDELKTTTEELEFKYSEVKYDLDITKHNYDLELESFGSAVNERESLIEKLQAKVDAFKRRYQTLEGRLQEAVTKEVECRSKIEEAEGRVRYEQAARENLIDARLEEAEIRTKSLEAELEQTKKTLEEQVSEKEASLAELKERVEELEQSLQQSAIAGDESGSAQEQFSYYRNRIETLGAQVESERTLRKSLGLQLDAQAKQFQKSLENEQLELAKERDQITQEKTAAEQKYRKLATKFKSKEREIFSLEERLRALNDSLEGNSTEPLEVIDENGVLSVNGVGDKRAVAAQFALKQAKLLEIQTRLDNSEEQLSELGETLTKERARRKELEVFYLAYNAGNRRRGQGLLGMISRGRGDGQDGDGQQLNDHNQHNGSVRKRLGSVSTFSMNMDENRASMPDDYADDDIADAKKRKRPIIGGLTLSRLILCGTAIYALLFCAYITYRQ